MFLYCYFLTVTGQYVPERNVPGHNVPEHNVPGHNVQLGLWLRLGLRLGLGLGLGSDIRIIVNIRVLDWVIMVIFPCRDISDLGRFDLVPFLMCLVSLL